MASSTTATNGRTLGGGLAPLGLTPEAAARKTQRRVNTRLLAGLVLVVVAFIGFLVFVVSSAPATRGIVVATRDLPAGTRLSRGDLAVAQVQVGQAQTQAAVPASALDGLAGKELVAPAFAQHPLAQAQINTGGRPALGPGQVKMTIPIRADSAVGGALRRGDEVSVLVTYDKGKPTAQTRTVLDRVVVDDVGRSDTIGSSGSAAGASRPDPSSPGRPVAWLTLIIPADLASATAQARWGGDLDVILLPPAAVAGTAP